MIVRVKVFKWVSLGDFLFFFLLWFGFEFASNNAGLRGHYSESFSESRILKLGYLTFSLLGLNIRIETINTPRNEVNIL